VKLLRRRAKTFDIQVQDLTLHITAPEDFAEEARAAALSIWEQLQSYGARDPDFRTSKRALTRVASDAPPCKRLRPPPPGSDLCSRSGAPRWTRRPVPRRAAGR
jgi:hypothetical protein